MGVGKMEFNVVVCKCKFEDYCNIGLIAQYLDVILRFRGGTEVRAMLGLGRGLDKSVCNFLCLLILVVLFIDWLIGCWGA